MHEGLVQVEEEKRQLTDTVQKQQRLITTQNQNIAGFQKIVEAKENEKLVLASQL